MWPVMTLTLLLQLTYEEQLFAQELESTVKPQVEELIAPAEAIAPEDTCADWPDATAPSC